MPVRGAVWSRDEVEATVAAYFEMLELGLRGEDYSKTASRAALLPLLGNRTPGAVERKHQNISAILIEERIPYISGYKPLGNYQELLREVVLEQLAARRVTRSIIEEEVLRVPTIPSVDDLVNALTEPPKPVAGMNKPRKRTVVRAPVDYMSMEAANRALGLAGEEFVVRWEQARLIAQRKPQLAAKVSHVSVERGDGLGFDVLSYEDDSRERLIEVKTTKFGEYTPFYVSENEVRVSREMAVHYHLYRVHTFGALPRMYVKSGALDETFRLNPANYIARVG